jgi:hypothetical protein
MTIAGKVIYQIPQAPGNAGARSAAEEVSETAEKAARAFAGVLPTRNSRRGALIVSGNSPQQCPKLVAMLIADDSKQP